MKKIGFFVPFRYKEKKINYKEIYRAFGSKEPYYVSKGRYAVIHILKSLGINNGTIGVSSYMCSSIYEVLKNYGYNLAYYDIDMMDLNPNYDSVVDLIENSSLSAIIIASMYGNPADLIKLEQLCKIKKVVMIDDAAQSFGAMIGERYVGSFGDGGFFSFSPGKPTSASRGGFFWTSAKEYSIKRTRHPLAALIIYKDFYYRRYLEYEDHRYKSKIYSLLSRITYRICDMSNDLPQKKEIYMMGGVLYNNKKSAHIVRQKWITMFSHIKTSDECRLILSLRGIPNNSKIVYFFNNMNLKRLFITFLKDNKISFYEGYSLPMDCIGLKNINDVVGHIIELPIEDDFDNMKYLYNKIVYFWSNNSFKL